MLPAKKTIIGYLQDGHYDAIFSMNVSTHRLTNILISLSYDKTSLVSWRAIEAIGSFTAIVAKTDPDTVRNVVGRLLWMIRDESGGIGWSCPEMLGEIVRNNPELCSDIAPIITSFHEEKMLLSGVLWAIGRIGKINDASVGYAIPVVLQYVHAPDDTVRGFAAFALGSLGALGAVPLLEGLKGDDHPLRIYAQGNLIDTTVGAIASEAVSLITKQHS